MVGRSEAAVTNADPDTRSRIDPAGAARAAGDARDGRTDLDAALRQIFSRMAVLTADSPERMRLRARAVELALPLVGRLARRFRGRGERLEDLTQTGALALVKAVDNYDPGRGVPFTGYLVPCVVGAFKRHFRDNGWDIRVPRPLQERHLAIERASEELTQRLRRAPTTVELADALGLDADEVVTGLAVRQAYDTASLNGPTGAEAGGDELQDLLGGPDGELEEMADRLSLGALLRRLPARERTIVIQRFFGNRTQLEIGTELGISQMQVSRILSRVLGWLRRALLDDAAGAYPGTQVNGPSAVRVRPAGRALLVTVQGVVDARNASRLHATLTKAVATHRPQQVIVDLHDVPSITTGGAAALAATCSACRRAGARLRLVRVAAPIVQVLERAHVTPKLVAPRPRPAHTATPPPAGRIPAAPSRREAAAVAAAAQRGRLTGERAATPPHGPRSERPAQRPANSHRSGCAPVHIDRAPPVCAKG